VKRKAKTFSDTLILYATPRMDSRELKRRFGNRLCFEGGVSVQITLPLGTTENVRREAKELIAVLGVGSGCILGPSHAIQAGAPPESITGCS